MIPRHLGGGLQGIDQHLGQRIAEARHMAGINCHQLATGLGISVDRLTRFETGQDHIPALCVALCARLLNQPLKWFFDGLPGQYVFDNLEKPDRIRLVK